VNFKVELAAPVRASIGKINRRKLGAKVLNFELGIIIG
jgi:hypothetical protein